MHLLRPCRVSYGASGLSPRQQEADRMSESAGPGGKIWTYSLFLICQLIGCQSETASVCVLSVPSLLGSQTKKYCTEC